MSKFRKVHSHEPDFSLPLSDFQFPLLRVMIRAGEGNPRVPKTEAAIPQWRRVERVGW
jgi:hypothetical protein